MWLKHGGQSEPGSLLLLQFLESALRVRRHFPLPFAFFERFPWRCQTFAEFLFELR